MYTVHVTGDRGGGAIWPAVSRFPVWNLQEIGGEPASHLPTFRRGNPVPPVWELRSSGQPVGKLSGAQTSPELRKARIIVFPCAGERRDTCMRRLFFFFGDPTQVDLGKLSGALKLWLLRSVHTGLTTAELTKCFCCRRMPCNPVCFS